MQGARHLEKTIAPPWPQDPTPVLGMNNGGAVYFKKDARRGERGERGGEGEMGGGGEGVMGRGKEGRRGKNELELRGVREYNVGR